MAEAGGGLGRLPGARTGLLAWRGRRGCTHLGVALAHHAGRGKFRQHYAEQGTHPMCSKHQCVIAEMLADIHSEKISAILDSTE